MATAAVLSGLAAVTFCYDKDDTTVTETTDNEPKNERPLASPISFEIAQVNAKQLLDLFKNSHENYGEYRQKHSVNDAYNIASDKILLGAQILEGSDPFQGSPYVSTDGGKVVIGGREFDLQNHTQFTFAQVLTEALLRSRFGSDIRGFETPFTQHTPDDIMILIGKIEFERTDISPFALRPEEIAEFAKEIGALESAGLTIPKTARITWNRETKSADGDVINLFLPDLTFEGRLLSDRSLAGFYLERDPNILTEYTKTINEVFANLPAPIQEAELSAPGYYGYLYDNDKDLFKEAFTSYISDGERFRRRIEYAKAKGLLSEQKLLEAHYDFMKRFFNGNEFTDNFALRKVVEYSPENVVDIHDWDKDHPGIFLRTEPTLEIDPKRPAVFDFSTVKLIEGPSIVLNDDTHEATRMWHVQEGTIINNRVFVSEEYHDSGWIPERALGEIILKR